MKEKVSIVKQVFGRIAEIWGMIPVEEIAFKTDAAHRRIFKNAAVNS